MDTRVEALGAELAGVEDACAELVARLARVSEQCRADAARLVEAHVRHVTGLLDRQWS